MFKYIKLVILMFFLCTFIYINHGNAATINAASCSRSDVLAAIDAALDGDTVQIPSGSATWDTGIAIKDKGLIIKGSGEGNTVLTDNTTNANDHMFKINAGGSYVEVFNMTIDGHPGSSDYWGHMIFGNSNIRVHHITFNTSGDRASLTFFGTVSNVCVDNCTFGTGSKGIVIYGNTGVWTDSTAYAPGTNAGVYIEDCTFNRSFGGPITAGYMGTRYVFRYNTVNNGNGLDVHGADSSERSGLYIEVYNNTFNATANKSQCINMRGGSAIIYENTFSTHFTVPMRLINYRTCYGCTPGPTAMHSNNKSRCKHNSTDPLDGDQDPPANGWPCKDQIGRGPNQSSQPCFEWNNKLSDDSDADFGVSGAWGCTNPSMADHIKVNRDYYNDTQKPGYTPYEYPHPLTKPDPPSNLRIVAP